MKLKIIIVTILLTAFSFGAETWTHVTDETSSVKPFRSTRYAFNALVTTNGTQGIANAVKPFTDARYAINSIVVTNESGEWAMAVRLVSGDPASLEEMQAMTNGCLQVSNQVTVASNQGYLKSLDSTGTNVICTTNLWVVGSDDFNALTNALKEAGVF